MSTNVVAFTSDKFTENMTTELTENIQDLIIVFPDKKPSGLIFLILGLISLYIINSECETLINFFRMPIVKILILGSIFLFEEFHLQLLIVFIFVLPHIKSQNISQKETIEKFSV